MTNEVIYKVLWVDDQTFENGEITEVYDGFQGRAESHGIELVPFDNWDEAEYSLKKDFNEYSAIILDAYCKIHKDDTEKEEFITAVLPSLTNIFGEKRKVLPWYILSAGTMKNFGNVVNGARYQHSKHEEDWGNMLYLKDTPDFEANPDRLFENITRIAKDMAMNVVLYRHHDAFSHMGQNQLIDVRARKLMLRMLSALYYPEENIGFEYKGNPLRQVLEYLFWSAFKHGLLPEECIEEEKGKRRIVVKLASLFMAGKDVEFKNKPGKPVIRWGKAPTEKDKNGGDAIFPTDIADIVKNAIEFTNKDSHASEDEPWYIDEERKDIFFGYVLQMCHVISWYGKYIKSHSDRSENLKMITLVK